MSTLQTAVQSMAVSGAADLLAMAGGLSAMRNGLGPRLADVLCTLSEIAIRGASYSSRNPDPQAAADYRAAVEQAMHAVYFAMVLHDQWLIGSPAPNVPAEALAAIQAEVRRRELAKGGKA